MTLSKQDIFSARPQPREIEVPEWGGTVRIRPVTLEEQGKLADLGRQFEGANNLTKLAKCTMALIRWTVVDENGEPLFTEQDMPNLLKITPAAAALRVQEAVLKISGLTEASREELAKNFLPTSVSEVGS